MSGGFCPVTCGVRGEQRRIQRFSSHKAAKFTQFFVFFCKLFIVCIRNFIGVYRLGAIATARGGVRSACIRWQGWGRLPSPYGSATDGECLTFCCKRMKFKSHVNRKNMFIFCSFFGGGGAIRSSGSPELQRVSGSVDCSLGDEIPRVYGFACSAWIFSNILIVDQANYPPVQQWSQVSHGHNSEIRYHYDKLHF